MFDEGAFTERLYKSRDTGGFSSSRWTSHYNSYREVILIRDDDDDDDDDDDEKKKIHA